MRLSSSCFRCSVYKYSQTTSTGSRVSCLSTLQQRKTRTPVEAPFSFNTTRFFSTASTPNNLFRIAIVGSGPSGCYTAKYLLQDKTLGNQVQIDILERLPTPYGLVRYGVAPDHASVKNVQNDFDALFEQFKGRLRYWGNVPVGDGQISVRDLRERYHSTVLAYGCASDREMKLSSIAAKEENTPTVLSARQFVAWYNGHPDFVHVGDTVKAALSKSAEGGSHVVVVGQGNVAVDCARVILKGSGNYLGDNGDSVALVDTDIASHALSVLNTCKIASVSLVGRRGPIQAAWTIKELRELATQLPGVSTTIAPDEWKTSTQSEASKEELANTRPKQRMMKLLQTLVNESDGHVSSENQSMQLRFLLSPQSLDSDSLVCERNELTGPAGQQRAQGTGCMVDIPAHLILTSIGYEGLPIDMHVSSFMKGGRGIVSNVHGMVDPATGNMGALYTSGWLKRGPSGIIGTNIGDAKDTVMSIVHDLQQPQVAALSFDETRNLESLVLERNIDYVDWEGYQRLEAAEQQHKRTERQPREKIVEIAKQLDATKR